MQPVTKAILLGPSLLALALAVSACGSDPEETPDITEAIPLDVDQEGDSSATETGGANGVGGSPADAAIQGDTPALPGASGEGNASAPSVSRQRSIPDTMEAGSNPPDMTEPPKGSKVQRFN